MNEDKKILAIIPARAGSKEIKDKNIKLLNGKPLLSYTIESAKKSDIFDSIIVSTDSEKIAQISKDYGAEVPFLRPENLARDESKTIDAVMHVIKELVLLGRYYDVVILLQPTSPLRTEKHIVEAYKLFVEKSFNSVMSICEVKDNPIFMKTMNNDGILKQMFENTTSSIRRQELDEIYRPNGAIYVNLLEELTISTSFNDNLYGYLMSKEDSVDIDELMDFYLAEQLIIKHKQ